MEEMNNRSSFFKGLKDKGTDVTLRILAFILAVISWFILSITQYPTVTKRIMGVHVNFNMDGTTASEMGLEALNYKDITVDVEISGMNYEIGTYNANDLIATVNLDGVNKEGTYNLDIDVRSAHNTDRCTILSVDPETVPVEFDRITEKTVEIKADAPNVTAEDGFTLNKVTVDPAEITIKGPKNILDKVSTVSAKVNNSVKLADNTTLSANELVFCDSKGETIDSSKFSVKGETSYDVNFTVYKKKTLELSVNYTGAPEGFDVSSLPLKLSQDSISVTTPHLDDEATEKVVLGNIPINEIDLKKTFKFKINIPAGDVNTSGSDTVIASFDDEGYSSAEFTLDTDNIDIISAPPKLTVDIDNKELPNVTVVGPTEIIDELTDDDIHAKINLSDVHGTGSYAKEATIYIPNINNVWSFGSNQIQVTISQPKSEDSSGSDSAED